MLPNSNYQSFLGGNIHLRIKDFSRFPFQSFFRTLTKRINPEKRISTTIGRIYEVFLSIAPLQTK
jgi:hypothetical protein